MANKESKPVSIIAIDTLNITMPGAATPNVMVTGLGSDGRIYCWQHEGGMWLPNWKSGMEKYLASQAQPGTPSPEKREALKKKRK